ncbi:uncharacterized protein EMH_0036190 [Eimeria mitis]|uniref:Ribonuclease PIN domain-containing protein n=1 Tax=Eimeria mitis TaxID=44415 RepID=U6JR49_9EIME|nr:uncharacterized protein EMH_0036190 [Eimeria mitis]CDJ27940.1 hypothetical protein, conserved [Eimeria mitis]
MTVPQQQTDAAGAAEISSSTSDSQTQEKHSSTAALSWAERASRAKAAAAAAPATARVSKTPTGPPTEASPGPPKELNAEESSGRKPQEQQQQQLAAAAAASKRVPIPALPSFARASAERPVVVLDAGALMRVEALDRYRDKCTFITTAEAAQEVRDALARQRIASRFLDVHTLEPSDADRRWAEKFASMTGDFPFLSSTDLSLIALTYMLQRATGQTQHLNAKPPAFEFFTETALMQQLESEGSGRGVWTLQRNSGPSPPGAAAAAAGAAAKTAAADTDAAEGGLHRTQQTEAENENESDNDDDYDDIDDDDDDDDMDEEEGWVTEDVLREHLGLAAASQESNHKETKPNDTNAENDINKLNKLNASKEIAETDDTNTATDLNASKSTNAEDVDISLSNAFSGLELRAEKLEIEG